MLRQVILSPDYVAFEETQAPPVKTKLRYAISILESQPLLSTKFVKKLINTDFYELRISMNNETRILVYAIDHANIMQARRLLLLNGFVKKGRADYGRAVQKALGIIRDLL